MTLPSLADLNALTCEHNVLMLLRALNTSDLAFMYMLLDDTTLADICDMSTRLLDAAERGYPEHNIAPFCALTPAEVAECRAYIVSMTPEK